MFYDAIYKLAATAFITLFSCGSAFAIIDNKIEQQTQNLATAKRSKVHLANVKTGHPAPTFQQQTLTGQLINLHTNQGKKWHYLVFWNTWCGYCGKKIPELNDLQQKYKQYLNIVSINTARSDPLPEVNNYILKNNIQYPVIYDQKQELARLYKVDLVPSTFLIDPKGILRYIDELPDNMAQLWTATSAEEQGNKSE